MSSKKSHREILCTFYPLYSQLTTPGQQHGDSQDREHFHAHKDPSYCPFMATLTSLPLPSPDPWPHPFSTYTALSSVIYPFIHLLTQQIFGQPLYASTKDITCITCTNHLWLGFTMESVRQTLTNSNQHRVASVIDTTTKQPVLCSRDNSEAAWEGRTGHTSQNEPIFEGQAGVPKQRLFRVCWADGGDAKERRRWVSTAASSLAFHPSACPLTPPSYPQDGDVWELTVWP